MAGDLFRPDGARARALAADLRLRLADSFEHLIEASQSHVVFDRAAAGGAIAAIRAADAVRPEVFIVHRECVQAARDGALDALAAGFGTLGRGRVEAMPGFAVRNWGDPSFSPAELARYGHVFGQQDGLTIAFAPVPACALTGSRRALDGALDVLQHFLPELAAEVQAVVHEVVLVHGNAGPGQTFDGVTAFWAWGALLLNAAAHQTVPDALAGLVHEAAHSYMLAVSQGAKLVTNSVEERYPSPLRHDPRPMNGVLHATIVAARIAYSMEGVLAADQLSGPDRERAEAIRAGARESFVAGRDVIRAHARPTERGKALIDGAESYMKAQKAFA